MLDVIRGAGKRKQAGRALTAAISERARDPLFFRDLAVADSFDGRFDMVTLHAWLVLERLETAGERDVAQAFTDALFVGFDEALRDQGAGDMGIGRRMKSIADAFYGRLKAYGEAQDAETLRAALLRNVYRGNADHASQAGALARYAMAARAVVASENIADGRVDFGPLPDAQ